MLDDEKQKIHEEQREQGADEGAFGPVAQAITREVVSRLNKETFYSPVVDLLSVSNESRGFWTFEDGDILDTALSRALTKGAHRCIVRFPGADDAILSQMDVISFLLKTCKDDKQLSGLLDSSVDALKIGTRDALLSVGRDASALDACRTIYRNMPVSAVPVVNPKNEVVDSFSASNLRGLNEYTVAALFCNVSDYLNLFPGPQRFPICASGENTLRHVVDLMVENQIHQVRALIEFQLKSGLPFSSLQIERVCSRGHTPPSGVDHGREQRASRRHHTQ